MEDSVSDLNAVLDIVLEHAKGTRPYKPFDSFLNVEVLVGGNKKRVCYGADGQQLFRNIFDRHIRKNLRDYENDDHLLNEMIECFLKRIIEKQDEVTPDLIRKVCDRINHKISKSLKKYSVYIPVNLFDIKDDEEITFGVLTLYSTGNEAVAKIAEYDQLALKNYNVIVKIDVECISSNFAFTRSEQILQAFMTTAHINFGLGFFHRNFSYYEKYDLGRSYKFYSLENNNIKSNERVVFGTETPEDWQDGLTSDVGKILREVLAYMSIANNDDVFAFRIFDALVLVREAVNEKFSYNRFTKLVTAIERLISTKAENEKITSRLIHRINLISNLFDGTDYLREIDFKKIYDFRSKIAHGSRSVVEDIDQTLVRDLILIVEHLIQSCACLYEVNNLLFKQVSDKRLDLLFKRLEEHLLAPEMVNND
ncbi:hypothetical protein L5168_004154 [Vibrio parahaemolyticus]|nr:hypothetical protein [Vibrio parahaemolyticus]